MNTRISAIFLSLAAGVLVFSSIWMFGQPMMAWGALLTGYLLWLNIFFSLKKTTQGSYLGAKMFTLSWMIFPLLKVIRPHLGWQADDWLIQVDSYLWGGKILPAYFHYEQHLWLTDVFCLCYFCFYFIVIASVIHYSFKGKRSVAEAFFNGLMFIYCVGYVGYFSLPAAGPAFYHLPDTGVGGHTISRWLIEMVKEGVTGMDVFPSLHTAVTVYVVVFFYRDGWTKIALALTPVAVCIVMATIFMRYHYGIDVLVGLFLVGIAYRFFVAKR